MHKPTDAELELSKIAPVRAGQQKPGSHLVFHGENRKQRRAEAADKRKPLPKSIWLITRVSSGQHIDTGTLGHIITIERRDQRDTITVFSKEGAAPTEGGLLERMTRPTGGEAAIWTDGRASKESMGGGYTRAAVPPEWGFPEPDVMPEPAARRFENLTVGEPWPGEIVNGR